MNLLQRLAPSVAIVALGVAAAVGASAATRVDAPAASTIDPAPVVAEATAGVAYVIESDYARGKAAVIGAEGAATAAALYTIPADADGIRDHAVVFYPVEGAEGTFVLANAAGEVLQRNANDSANPRHLSISELSVGEALAQPSAQWTVHDRGNGVIQLLNVATYANSAPTLDLYDWRTADGSQVQTWDQTTNAVQMWRMHELTVNVEPITRLVSTGTVPTLPATVRGGYGWGAARDLAVSWQMPDPAVWNTDGVVTVDGTATGLFGESVQLSASVTVGTVGDATPVTMTTYVGAGVDRVRLDAPRTVERTVSGSETTVPADVTWNWDAVPADAFAQEGTVDVHAVAGLGFDALLTITVAPATEANLLTQPGSRAWRFAANGFTPSALIDGDRDAVATDDWRSGGAANRVGTNWIAWYFATPQEVSRMTLAEPTGAANVGEVTFEYRNMRGGWEALSAGTIPSTDGRLALDVPVEPVLATGVRAVYTHKSDATWMTISEFGAFGPSSATN